MVEKMLKAVRLHDWWHFIIPPILGFYFLGVQYNEGAFDLVEILVGSSILLLIAIPVASFGFFLNEWTDIKEDSLAGKPNHVSFIKPIWRPVIFLVIIAATGLSLLLPGITPTVRWLVLLQMISFVLYSTPYLRFKERPLIAVFLDALYSGTLFYVIALLLSGDSLAMHIIAGALTFGMMRGFRNILFHLLQDLEHDAAAGKKTLAHLISEKGMIRAQEVLWLMEVAIILVLCYLAGHVTFAILFIGFLLILIKRHFYVIRRVEEDKENLVWLGELNTLYELWFMFAAMTGALVSNGWLELLMSWAVMFFLFPYSRKIFNELHIGLYNLYYFISDLYFVYTKPHFDIGKILRRVFRR